MTKRWRSPYKISEGRIDNRDGIDAKAAMQEILEAQRKEAEEIHPSEISGGQDANHNGD